MSVAVGTVIAASVAAAAISMTSASTLARVSPGGTALSAPDAIARAHAGTALTDPLARAVATARTGAARRLVTAYRAATAETRADLRGSTPGRAGHQRAIQHRPAQQRRAQHRAARRPARPSGTPQQIAMAMLAGYGWSRGQFSCLDYLWTRESGWNPYATNPTSGAYGIPQALPSAKMATAGADWQTNPATQIRWGLGYIKATYGSPCGAWAHETAYGWY
jgi:hypothetical protein